MPNLFMNEGREIGRVEVQVLLLDVLVASRHPSRQQQIRTDIRKALCFEHEYTDSFLRNRFAPLVPRYRIIEIDERIDVNGRVVTPLDEAQARVAIRAMAKASIEAVAVCTLFATVNPVHERRLREIVSEEMPKAYVSVSHEISPNIGEYARMSTTAANAALGPIAGG